jgi:hypothetical protein
LLASTGERMSFHEAARQYDKKALQVIASILMDEKSELINHVRGIAVLISPASSMKRVAISNSRAFQVR